jgi:hypothetical protein
LRLIGGGQRRQAFEVVFGRADRGFALAQASQHGDDGDRCDGQQYQQHQPAAQAVQAKTAR